MGNELTVTCIQQRSKLVELEPEWDSLLDCTEVASPFLTHGWQMAWLDTYGVKYQPFVLVARRAGELIGLWPLASQRRGLFKVLYPLGAGRSDWLDVPAHVLQRRAAIEAFFKYLVGHRGSWDLIELRDVLSDSPTIPILKSLSSERGIRLRYQPRSVAPFMSITGTWEQFLSSKRAKFRSNLKYYRRLAERNGQRFNIRLLQWGIDNATVDYLAGIELHSWKARDGNLKVSTPVGREFYRRFCNYLSNRGWLEVWGAELDDSPVAFILNIIYGRKCYHYNTCYDEAFAHLSPGVLLHAEAIARAFRQELREYDFLSGDEPYKDRWSTNKREILHLALHNGRPASMAAFSTLVSLRWTFRKSEKLRRSRDMLVSRVRRLLREKNRE